MFEITLLSSGVRGSLLPCLHALCVPVVCSGCCSAGASGERRGRVGAAGLGLGWAGGSIPHPSLQAVPARAETFPAAHPSPRAAASQQRISSAGEQRKFKAWLCLCRGDGCWLQGDGGQSGSLWGSLKKFCSAVVLPDRPGCRAQAGRWRWGCSAGHPCPGIWEGNFY